MPDIAYILGTLAFFAAALAYVAACERLGGGAAPSADAPSDRARDRAA